MSTDLIDSNLIIYATQPNHENLRQYIADNAPAVAVISKIETLGYHKLSSEGKKFLEEFFDAAHLLPVSQQAVEHAISLHQKRRISLGDSLIAGVAPSHGLRLATHNITDFDWINELEVFDPLSIER